MTPDITPAAREAALQIERIIRPNLFLNERAEPESIIQLAINTAVAQAKEEHRKTLRRILTMLDMASPHEVVIHFMNEALSQPNQTGEPPVPSSAEGRLTCTCDVAPPTMCPVHAKYEVAFPQAEAAFGVGDDDPLPSSAEPPVDHKWTCSCDVTPESDCPVHWWKKFAVNKADPIRSTTIHRENYSRTEMITAIARLLHAKTSELQREAATWKRRAEEKEKPTLALGRELEAARQQLAEKDKDLRIWQASSHEMKAQRDEKERERDEARAKCNLFAIGRDAAIEVCEEYEKERDTALTAQKQAEERLAAVEKERDNWKRWQENTREGGQILAAERDQLRAYLAAAQADVKLLAWLVAQAKAPNWARDWPQAWKLEVWLNASNHDGEEPDFKTVAIRYMEAQALQPQAAPGDGEAGR